MWNIETNSTTVIHRLGCRLKNRSIYILPNRRFYSIPVIQNLTCLALKNCWYSIKIKVWWKEVNLFDHCHYNCFGILLNVHSRRAMVTRFFKFLKKSIIHGSTLYCYIHLLFEEEGGTAAFPNLYVVNHGFLIHTTIRHKNSESRN